MKSAMEALVLSTQRCTSKEDMAREEILEIKRKIAANEKEFEVQREKEAELDLDSVIAKMQTEKEADDRERAKYESQKEALNLSMYLAKMKGQEEAISCYNNKTKSQEVTINQPNNFNILADFKKSNSTGLKQ